VVVAQRPTLGGQRLAVERLGRGEVVAAAKQVGQQGQAGGAVGVVAPDGGLADLQRLGQQRLGPRVVLPADHQAGQPVEAGRVVGVVLAQGLLADPQHALVEGLGVRQLVAPGQDVAERAEAGGVIGVALADDPRLEVDQFADPLLGVGRTPLLEQLPRLVGEPLGLVPVDVAVFLDRRAARRVEQSHACPPPAPSRRAPSRHPAPGRLREL